MQVLTDTFSDADVCFKQDFNKSTSSQFLKIHVLPSLAGKSNILPKRGRKKFMLSKTTANVRCKYSFVSFHYSQDGKFSSQTDLRAAAVDFEQDQNDFRKLLVVFTDISLLHK